MDTTEVSSEQGKSWSPAVLWTFQQNMAQGVQHWGFWFAPCPCGFFPLLGSGHFLQQQMMGLCWSPLLVDFDAIQCISTAEPMQVSYQQANGRWPGHSPGQSPELWFRMEIQESGDSANVFLQMKTLEISLHLAGIHVGRRESMFILNKGSSETLWTKMNAAIFKIEFKGRESGDWTCMFLYFICWCYHPLRYIIWVSQTAVTLLKPSVGRYSWYSDIIYVNWWAIALEVLLQRLL